MAARLLRQMDFAEKKNTRYSFPHSKHFGNRNTAVSSGGAHCCLSTFVHLCMGVCV